MASLLKKASELLETKGSSWRRLFGAAGGIFLLLMTVVTVSDAVGRKLSHPIYGAYELVSFILSLVVFSSLCYCGFRKQHLVINIVTNHFPARSRLIIVTIMYSISALLCWILSWQLVVYGLGQKSFNATGMEFTWMPTYPYIWSAAFCSAILGFILLFQGFQFCAKALDRTGTVETTETQ